MAWRLSAARHGVIIGIIARIFYLAANNLENRIGSNHGRHLWA